MNKYLEQVREKIVDISSLDKKLKQWRAEQQSIVFTNGCFDILHLGHISYLLQAADKGDVFIVALNSDVSVRGLNKSPERPIMDQNARAFAIASLVCTDAVIVFENETPLELIEHIHPDVLVKGADYDPSETDSSKKSYIVGSRETKARGGKVEVIPFLEGYSTTSIISKIKS